MEFRQLKWIFLAGLAMVIVVLEYARHLLEPHLESRAGRILMDAVVLLCVVFVVGAAISILSGMKESLARKNRELMALHRAALDIYGELSLQTVIEKLVEQARNLLDARYGAVAIVDDEGAIKEFVSAGLAPGQHDAIGDPPQGRGLLGVVLDDGQRLRLADLSSDPRSIGFPPGHPTMKSMLAVPIVCECELRGNLYLTDKIGEEEFSEEDEETLVRLATAAAIAIDNSTLHEKLESMAVSEERVRISREMHDGMAQVLAYVNTKAQAVEQYLHTGRTEEAERQLEQLAAAAREAYTDIREAILSLRTQVSEERSLIEALEEFFVSWRSRSGVDGWLIVDDELHLPPPVELQLLRITQEALSNVRKHARADFAVVELVTEGGKVHLTIRDDGTGFDAAVKTRSEFPRFGLKIMRERAESIGGNLVLDTSPGGGTRVRIEVPLRVDTG